MNEQLAELIKEYLGYITCNHHKRRDMYFSIEKVWDCAEFKGFRVIHDGYVNNDTSEFFKTEHDAEVYLVNLLRCWIVAEVNWIEEERKAQEK